MRMTKVYPRVLVFGGRDFNEGQYVYSRMDMLISVFRQQFMVVEGGARGADTLAGNWAKENGYPHAKVDANWDFYKNAAGPIRNTWMKNFLQPHFGVEFPGGKGTADMRKLLDAAGIPVWRPLAEDRPPESFSLEKMKNEVIR
jgi:hypothetical protein